MILRITLALLLVLAPTAIAAPERPNLLLILIDDMGWGDFSCFGNEEASTPHIDRLAAEGIRFHQFYVNSPICSASRCAISTGQWPARWGITSYLSGRKDNAARGVKDWLSLEAPFLARFLHDEAGYATGHFGKWHLGGQRDVGDAPLITEYGFDRSVTNFEGLGHRILPLKYSPGAEKPQPHALKSDTLGRGPIEWEDRSILTGRFAQHALEFIQKAESQGRPFYVNIWPDDTHTPMVPPLHDWGDGEPRTLYKAVLEEMDHQLSRVFNHLRRSEALRDNTLVLICSDNGPEVGYGDPGPFFGNKATLHEAGIRSPLIVWGPGLQEAGKAGFVNKESVLSAVDLAPSLLRLAGLEPESLAEFDGEDLLPTLLGKSEASRKAPLYFRRPPDRENFRHYKSLPDLATRTGQWKLLCEFDGSRPRLFDIANDPMQENDLAAKHPEVVEKLTASVLAWEESMPKDRGRELPKKK